MSKIASALLLVGGLTVISSPVVAKDADTKDLAKPKLYDDLVNCRKIEKSDERLACYDARVAALDAAQASKDIVITDKAAIKEARRGLFGFDLPKIRLFGSDEDDVIVEVEAAISEAWINGEGKVSLTLEDGARWTQTDSTRVNRTPKAGMNARIRRAAMGSFFVNIDGQRAIRMKRLN